MREESNNYRKWRWSICPSEEAVICFWGFVVLGVIVTICWTCVQIGEMNTQENLKALEQGYVQTPTQGAGYHWSKPERGTQQQ